MITEKAIRAAIVDVIKTAYPDAVTYERNVLTSGRDTWASLFRRQVVNEIFTHGWIVRRKSTTKTFNADYRTSEFEVLGFYGFKFGTTATNSENEFQAIIDNLVEIFDGVVELGLGGSVMHEGLSMPDIGLINTKDTEFLHIAIGQMRVRDFSC